MLLNFRLTVLKALADPVRLEIIEFLKDGEKCVCEIVSAIGKAQSTVSKHLDTLYHADILEKRVDGEVVSPPRRDPFKFLINPLKFVLQAIIATSKVGFKLAVTLILMGIIVFSYLYFTMESEKGLVEKIEQSQVKIRIAQEKLSKVNKELEEIREEIAGIREDEANRRDEITVMDLNLKVYKLSEERQKARIEADMEQDILEKNQKSLEEMQQKSFLEKLLKM